MLVDADIIIWNWRGELQAAKMLDAVRPFSLSAVAYMELVQGMRNRREWEALRTDLKHWQASILPITETISAGAVRLVEEHFRSHHFQLADALIAATAIQQELPLATGNVKHFKAVKGLKLQQFTIG